MSSPLCVLLTGGDAVEPRSIDMMAETHSKTQTSTTTITTTTTPTYAPPQKSSGISLCLQYFKTGPGIVKLVELVSKYLVTHDTYLAVSDKSVYNIRLTATNRGPQRVLTQKGILSVTPIFGWTVDGQRRKLELRCQGSIADHIYDNRPSVMRGDDRQYIMYNRGRSAYCNRENKNPVN